MMAREWKAEATRLIIEAINKLPHPEREAFVCKHYKGMTLEEIAGNLHRSVAETKEILKKAEHRVNQDLNRMNGAMVQTRYAFC